MGSGSSKSKSNSGPAVTCSGEPGKTKVEAFVNPHCGGPVDENNVKSDNIAIHPKPVKRNSWEKFVPPRRESRLKARDKCLVGLESTRRTASPQLLMASRENYGRIKDASDLLRMEPSETDFIDPLGLPGAVDTGEELTVPGSHITNQTIYREVSDTSKTTMSTWLATDTKPSREKISEDLRGIMRDKQIRSRENSLERNDGRSLGPLRYGKLGLQGGVIRKELEKDGILSVCDRQKNPDVVLRELRQMGLVKQTGSGTSYSLHEDYTDSNATRSSKLPPLERDILSQRIEEKHRRHQEQLKKNEEERQQKVRKFRERHKSAKERRTTQSQQEPEAENDEPTQSTEDAERLKLKMLNMDIL